MRYRPVACTLLCLMVAGAVRAEPVVSYFPKGNLGRFLAEKFDLATIRSSLGPRRTAALRTFADFGMKPTKATGNDLVIERPGDWFYELRILDRRDVNGDGIEDLEVCFVDRALNGGTYNAAQGLLVTRYSADGYAIALGYTPGDGVCAN